MLKMVVLFLLSPFLRLGLFVITLLQVFIALPFLLIELVKKGGCGYRFDELFDFMDAVPYGRVLFSSLVGIFAPYAASIEATVCSVSPHSCMISMTERPWLRNPFNSIHAAAICNLGEMGTGLSFLCYQQHHKGVRGVPKSLNVDFKKKARGTLTAVCDLTKGSGGDMCIPTATGRHIVDLLTTIKDETGDVVATVNVTWNVDIKSKEE